jgi:NADPH:quinone reductase
VDIVRRHGADIVLNYAHDDVTSTVRSATAGKGVDVWFETLPPADFERTFDLTARNGRVVVMAGRAAKPIFPNGLFYTKNLQLIGFAMFTYSAAEQQSAANDIMTWMAFGKLKPVIGAEFPLAQAADAHRLQEANTLHKAGTLTGKIVVIPG